MPLLQPGEPPAFTAENLAGRSPCLLLCEHASNRIPRALGDLGLPPGEIERHIGRDIGALVMARALSRHLDAALFSTGYSRLVIDCNRPLSRPGSIPEISEETVVPGNLGLSAADRAARQNELFHPFHDAVTAHLDATPARRCVIGVHSFTPSYRGVSRPWEAGFLYASAGRFAAPMMEGLRAQGFTVGDNEPYVIDADDYTVPVHGEARGLPSLLIEIRQDLIAHDAAALDWARRLAPLIARAIASVTEDA
ncbi:N-formylglutamate amidohydrolase [Acetobacteraceae bacterium H6797]|nr:N-formylglutamate amidohydrolase [Acetobacteraceae bacterium H6797]